MDHVGINAASPQPTGQPKTIPCGLIRDRNPRDLLPRLDGLVTPTIQKLQLLFRIRRNLLQRFAIDARDHAGDEPARESHFYVDYESAILHKGGAADFGCRGVSAYEAPSMTVDRSDDAKTVSPPNP